MRWNVAIDGARSSLEHWHENDQDQGIEHLSCTMAKTVFTSAIVDEMGMSIQADQ